MPHPLLALVCAGTALLFVCIGVISLAHKVGTDTEEPEEAPVGQGLASCGALLLAFATVAGAIVLLIAALIKLLAP